MDKTRDELWAIQDDCLIAIEDGKAPPRDKLRSLPPFRAVLIAAVAVRAGVMEQTSFEILKRDALAAGGEGTLPK